MKLYTLKEVAEILHVTYNTVFNLVQSGKIKAVKIGRTLRISQEEADRLTKEGTE
jgi:excisionase family DNA binding protein